MAKVICICSLLLLASLAAAQQAAGQQPCCDPLESRLRALEDKIRALEEEVQQLRAVQASPPATAPSAVAAAGAPVAPAQTVPAPGSGQLPVYGGASALAKALNPDIGLIGTFLGTAGGNRIRPSPSFEMAESELSLQAIIDPYARGDFFLSFGEEGVELEEGYITFTALPAGLVAKAGKMRSAFGKVNPMHRHMLPWTDRPLVTENLLGGEEGITDAGFSVSRILPAPKGIFLEATGQVFRGDSGAEEEPVFIASRQSDVSTVAHLRGYRDLTESTNLDLGLSFARGQNDAGSTTNIYGVDATLRWKPLRRAIYRSFIARSEFVWSQRRQQPEALLPAVQRAFGFYTSADFQFNRRWTAGARYDWSERARNAFESDRGASALLTFRPSEFTELRGQYRFTRFAEGVDANEFRLQLQFSLGAHGAHPF
jgi:hypothetical protein